MCQINDKIYQLHGTATPATEYNRDAHDSRTAPVGVHFRRYKTKALNEVPSAGSVVSSAQH
jgi:hypothetical protein